MELGQGLMQKLIREYDMKYEAGDGKSSGIFITRRGPLITWIRPEASYADSIEGSSIAAEITVPIAKGRIEDPLKMEDLSRIKDYLSSFQEEYRRLEQFGYEGKVHFRRDSVASFYGIPFLDEESLLKIMLAFELK